MATASPADSSPSTYLTVCPVCFQRFNKPRMLPCSHTFCHNCLDGLIKSSCSSATSLGFTCPLCREFIAAPGVVGQWTSDKWASLFPLNQFIEYLIEKESEVSATNCDACAEDGEDVKAINWCKDCKRSFCENCTKIHKRFLALYNHNTVSLCEISSATKLTEVVSRFCKTHEQNKLELYCRDHQVPSCALCVPTLHRTCDHIGTIQEEVIKSYKTNLLAKGLVKEMQAFCDSVEKLIEEEKMNITGIDEKTDMYIDMVKSACERLVQQFKKLEEKQLNEIAQISKDSKAKLETSIWDHENRRAYVQNCLKLMTETLENGDNADLLLQYYVMKEKLREIRKIKLQTVKIDLTATPIDETVNLKGFLNLKMAEKSINIPETIDVGRSKLHVINHFTVLNSDIRGGAFLSDGRLLLIDFNHSRCLLYKEKGVMELEAKFSGEVWDAYVNSDVLYITFSDTKEVKMVKLEDLSVIKSFQVNCSCRGITKVGDKIVLAGRTLIETCNGDFEHLDQAEVDADTDDVAADSDGNIIYSTYQTSTVIKKRHMTSTISYTYKHSSLCAPFGLAVDHMGNAYVCGNESNNIHIVSTDGKTLKILDAFTQPQCVKIQTNSVKFFVVEEKSKVKICELREG
ncbi:E3 ubiquitin-protein ligase TRIM45-like [Saccostrea cucullata]|uniref:E3 ubiquitin-protein ligase TRIM45-like n=1 Tax=Saccostrea cuccullata TaxID=36930 RepID=UPI002ED3F7CE